MKRDLKPLGLLLSLLFMAITILFLFGSCVSQNRLPQTQIIETVKTVETTVYKDTTIYRTLPGDTIKVEKIIDVSVLDIEPLTAENAFAFAQAWVYGNKLHLYLLTKPQTFEFNLQNKLHTKQSDRVKTVETIKQVKHIPKWLLWLLGFLGINLLLTVYRIKITGRFL